MLSATPSMDTFGVLTLFIQHIQHGDSCRRRYSPHNSFSHLLRAPLQKFRKQFIHNIYILGLLSTSEIDSRKLGKVCVCVLLSLNGSNILCDITIVTMQILYDFLGTRGQFNIFVEQFVPRVGSILRDMRRTIRNRMNVGATNSESNLIHDDTLIAKYIINDALNAWLMAQRVIKEKVFVKGKQYAFPRN